MSYLFDGSNDQMYFDSGSTGFATPSSGGVPCVISVWVKANSANIASNCNILQWGNATNITSGLRVFQRNTNNPDNWALTVGSSTAVASSEDVVADTWVNVIAYWTSSTERHIWTDNSGDGGGSGLASQSIATSYDTLLLGKQGDAGTFWAGKLAHLVICENYTLTADDRDYLAGTNVNGNNAGLTAYRPDHANLSALYAKAVAYYPFTADATDAKNSYDLTVDGAVVDADNPTLSSGASAVKGRNLLLGVG